MGDFRLVLVLLLYAIAAAHGYSWGRHVGREKGREEGIETGKQEMLAWMRAEGMKRRPPRVTILSISDDE